MSQNFVLNYQNGYQLTAGPRRGNQMENKGNSTGKDKSEQWGKRIRTSIDSGSVIEIDKEGVGRKVKVWK